MRNWGNINLNEHPEARGHGAMPYPSHKLTALLPSEEAAWKAIEASAPGACPRGRSSCTTARPAQRGSKPGAVRAGE